MLITRIISLIFLIPSLSTAQIKLSGRIVDATTKQSISFVNLENFRIKKGTQSNEHGAFVFEMLNGNSQDTLKISCVGYQDKLITHLNSGTNIIYELSPVVVQLKEVIIGKICLEK